MSSIIRTSDSAHLGLIQTLVNGNRSQYNTLTEQIASGSKYLKRSDNAAETNKAALVDDDETKNSQFKRNVSTASNWETSTYSYLDDMSGQFRSAVSLATEANNTIEEVSGWADIATELDSVIDSVLADANSKYLGTSLFAGTGTSETSDPFSMVAATNGGGTPVSGFYQVSYTGNDSARTMKASSTSTASTQYGTTGNELFDGVPITLSSGSSRTFNSLQAVSDMKSYLECKGNLTSDQLSYLQEEYCIPAGSAEAPTAETIFGRILNVVQGGSTQISNLKAANSSSSNRLESLSSTLDDSISTAENAYSDITKVDTVKAATDLANIQAVLTASLSIAGQISKYNLVNFI